MPEPLVKTSADVFKVLCHEIAECSAGRTDATRANTICRLTDAAVKLARLQMEANADETKARGIQLLEDVPDEAETDRLTARLQEVEKALSVVESALDNPKTEDSKIPALRSKADDLKQEKLNLKWILEKRH
ncbi:MAG TPA: hypothetical protein PKI20_05880 [Verrucomicrobiota bacterium]|nr:hypothetical protein [Verrucomicrobiota bacterium]HQL77163.1 hypothetical protein [Verrucomicrobiota bacterium]